MKKNTKQILIIVIGFVILTLTKNFINNKKEE